MNNIHIKTTAIITLWSFALSAHSGEPDFNAEFESFKHSASSEFSSFRQQCNREYAEFLKQAWECYISNEPLKKPVEQNPLPPVPYNPVPTVDPVNPKPIAPPINQNRPTIRPIVKPINIPKPTPRPKPIEPVKNSTTPSNDSLVFDFYGIACNVRIDKKPKLNISKYTPDGVSDAWLTFSDTSMDMTLYDCLKIKEKHNLCDWAYMLLLNKVSHKYWGNGNESVLFMAWLYSQSGYDMKLANDGTKLYLLFCSNHLIYDHVFYTVNNKRYYPFDDQAKSLKICNASFPETQPLSLTIDKDLQFGNELSPVRTIQSKQYPDLAPSTSVPVNAIKFFDKYPSSAIDNNPLTRWAIYANTPMSASTRNTLYPVLSEAIRSKDIQVAAGILLNWVQTGFTYEFDDKVWGGDRAFFAEETLYYPYCDCEDRAILFSRIIRDLLGLDVALLYYPGHLATAICFDSEVSGDAVEIDGRRFVICDPTYIGAPVGAQMPGLDYEKLQSQVLKE